MTPGSPVGGGEDLRRRALAYIRTTAPFAYCNACLALRLEASLTDMVAALAELATDGDALLTRSRRSCYGCGRVLEIAALREGPALG